MLDQMITYQAQVIAYNNDYWLMGIVSAPILLLVMLMRKPPSEPPQHAASTGVLDPRLSQMARGAFCRREQTSMSPAPQPPGCRTRVSAD